MNNKLLKSVVVVGSVCAALSSFGAVERNGMYLKTEAGYSNFQPYTKFSKAFEENDKIDTKKLKNAFSKSVPTAGITVGKHFGDFDMELGYSVLRTGNKNLTTNSDLAGDATNTDGGVESAKQYAKIGNKINNVNLDAKYNLNVGSGFKLVPSVGLGYMHSNASLKDAGHSLDDKTLSDFKRIAKKNANQIQPRAGLGLNYDVSRNVTLGGSVSHQLSNNFYKGATAVKVGLELGF